MFPRLLKFVNRIVPAKITHGWNIYKAVAAFAALSMVLVLVPLPRELPIGKADAFVVMTTGDAGDFGGGNNDGDCDPDDNGDESDCTLRAAIEEANSNSQADTITFGPAFSTADGVVTTIAIDSPLVIGTDASTTITGSLGGNDELHVAIAPSGSFSDPNEFASCTFGYSPLLHIETDSNLIENLIFYSSTDGLLAGNAIEIVDGDTNTIQNNWIGTTDRDDTVSPEGNGGYGICVFANTTAVFGTTIQGNIVVASGFDGIRLEGQYDPNNDYIRNAVLGNTIENNLVGNLIGDDPASDPYFPGNIFSGITLKNADDNTIKRNVITNNGIFPGEFAVVTGMDGITLLEANSNKISENYIGTTQDLDLSSFPLPLDSGGLDIASVHPGEAENYSPASNNCDGIGIRFYDHVDPSSALFPGPKFPTPCLDEDTFLASNPSQDPANYFDAKDIGPSVNNFVYNNDIGSNYRNGIFVQSVACPFFLAQTLTTHRNLRNVMTDDSDVVVFTQSAQNTFLQNSIFYNDNEQPNVLTTGSGSYGIGIDLEDFATASLDLFDPFVSTGSYWGQHFANNPAPFNFCQPGDFISSVEPIQPDSDEIDYNITENDSYPLDSDAGFDPDAGANRLQNFPVIDEAGSTPSLIIGTAPEGSLVELFQVICTSGTSLPQDIVPGLNTDIRNTCDVDTWSDEDVDDGAIADVHKRGHGQGFRFLGNAFVPGDPTSFIDADHEGPWTINPAEFVDGSFHDVADFKGGLITATATAFRNSELCWDDGSATECDPAVAPASADDISAQRAGSTGSGGLWTPDDLPLICTPVQGQAVYDDTPEYIDDFLNFCLGSTSEFSANAFVGVDEYTLEKTSNPASGTVSGGDTVTYTITLTNTGSTVLTLSSGSLSDILPIDSIDLVDCVGSILPGGPFDLNCSPDTEPDPIDETNFGTLDPGETIIITITTEVLTDLSTPEECTFNNTVTASGAFITGFYGPATETGTLLDDNSTQDLNVVPCGTTGATFEKLVRVTDTGSYLDGDTATPSISERGDSITYLMHFTNNSGTGTGVFLTDTFPATGLSGTPTYECWINGTPGDTDPTDDTAIPCTYNTGAGAFDSDSSTGAVDPFTVGDGETLHVRVSGYTVTMTYPLGSADICNVAEIHLALTGPAIFSDNACVRVLDPNLVIYKSVLTPNSSPAGESNGSPGPQVPAGDAVTYYIDVANTGTGTLTGLTLTDTFPTGMGGSPAWTCEFFVEVGTTETDHSAEVYPAAPSCIVNPTTGVITGIPTTIDQFEVLRIRLSGRNVPTTAVGTTLCNVIDVDANLFVDRTSQACVQVIGPELAIVKTASPTNPSPGASVTYTLTVTNNGTLPALGVQIVDDLDDSSSGTDLIPACVSSIANVTPQDGGVTGAGNVVTWPALDLPAGASRTVHMVVTIRSDILLSTSCRNVAVASGTNVTSDNDDADISIQAAVDFEKEVTNDSGGSDDPDVYDLGDTVSYRLTIRNNTPSNISNLTTRDAIPEEEEDLRDVIATSGAVNNTELNNDRLEVNNISISGNGTATVDYDVSILEDSDFPLDNYGLDSDADQEDDDFYPEDVEDDDIESSDNDDPEDALGSPDGHFVSLGEDGELTVSTSDEDETQGKLIVDGDGDDFCILELDPSGQDNDSADEEYEVEVSQTDRDSDFTSVGRATDNSECFDIGDADDDITWARYVRIIDTSNRTRDDAPGSDIDAVCILNLGGFVENTASLYSGTTLLGTRDEEILVDFTDAFDDPLRPNDCREPRLPPQDFPLPPPPGPPPYVPPIPFFPFTGLPTTGPLSNAAVPLASGILGLIAWVMKRKKF